MASARAASGASGLLGRNLADVGRDQQVPGQVLVAHRGEDPVDLGHGVVRGQRGPSASDLGVHRHEMAEHAVAESVMHRAVRGLRSGCRSTYDVDDRDVLW